MSGRRPRPVRCGICGKVLGSLYFTTYGIPLCGEGCEERLEAVVAALEKSGVVTRP